MHYTASEINIAKYVLIYILKLIKGSLFNKLYLWDGNRFRLHIFHICK